jgi:hypothetical protein
MVSKFKNCLSIILCFVFYTSYAQKTIANRVDSIYYLIDTAKTPFNDRMWDIGIEGSFKYYTIACSCLQYNRQPTFFYRTNFKGQVIKQKDLNRFKFIKLSDLIIKAKKYTDTTYKGKYAIFFVEHSDGKFILHKVSLSEPRKPVVNIDYEIMPMDSTKTKH